MKRIYFSLFIISVFLFSCKDDDTIEIRTSLPITVSVNVTEPTDQEAGQSEYSFETSQTYSLSNNDDVKEYLDNLKHISTKGYSGEITGLEDGEMINHIQISVADGSKLIVRENITNVDPGTQLPNNTGAYGIIGEELQSEKQITVTVTGTTNKAPMDFDVIVTLQIEVVAEEI